jgi:hypothetical protein
MQRNMAPVRDRSQLSPGRGRFEKSWYVIIIFDIVPFSKILSQQPALERMNWFVPKRLLST